MATTFSFKGDGLKFSILKLFKATTWYNGVISVFTTALLRLTCIVTWKVHAVHCSQNVDVSVIMVSAPWCIFFISSVKLYVGIMCMGEST